MPSFFYFFFFFNDTATTEIYTLSLHDALPIFRSARSYSPSRRCKVALTKWTTASFGASRRIRAIRSEEHTSELQSRLHLVCRLLLEKKKSAQSACRRTGSTPLHHLYRCYSARD